MLFFQNNAIIFLFPALISQAVQQLQPADETNPSTNARVWKRERKKAKHERRGGQKKQQPNYNNICCVRYIT